MNFAFHLGRSEHILECPSHSGRDSHQRSGDPGDQQQQKQPSFFHNAEGQRENPWQIAWKYSEDI